MNQRIAGAFAGVVLAALIMPVAAFANGWLASNIAFGTGEGSFMREAVDNASAQALNSFDVALTQAPAHLAASGGFMDADGNDTCDLYETGGASNDGIVYGCGCEQGQEQGFDHGVGKQSCWH